MRPTTRPFEQATTRPFAQATTHPFAQAITHPFAQTTTHPFAQAHMSPTQSVPTSEEVAKKFPYVGPLLADKRTGELLGRQVEKVEDNKVMVKTMEQSLVQLPVKDTKIINEHPRVAVSENKCLAVMFISKLLEPQLIHAQKTNTHR